ncbi:MAG: ATP-binding protein, partial [Bacteroidota bacterium]
SEIQSPELLEYLEFLDKSVIRLEKFSYQALLITELRTNNTQINIEEVPLADLFNRSNSMFHKVIQSKKIKVLLQNDLSVNVIHGNSELLHICFDYLIDNAVKYSSPGEVVIVKVYPDNECTVCEFIDNGPGFSPYALNKLYGLFSVGDRHIDNNTGLNLALIKLIMEAHRGQIDVSNNQPGGATVKLTFNNQRQALLR